VKSSWRGFTLVEVVVALGIAVMLNLLLLRVTVPALRVLALQTAREGSRSAMDLLVDRLRIDVDSAWAIFTPPADALGHSNDDGHEVAFFMRDGSGRAYFWSYTYDRESQTVTRYLYRSIGAPPTADERYTGLTQFTSHTYPVTALQDPKTAVYSPLYDGAHLTAAAVTFFGAAHAEVAGGNAITLVQMRAPALARDLALVTRTAPTGFTIVLEYTPAP
jgi:type II secretory pathway pseudopilin PulG